jgi:hypothetical protein
MPKTCCQPSDLYPDGADLLDDPAEEPTPTMIAGAMRSMLAADHPRAVNADTRAWWIHVEDHPGTILDRYSWGLASGTPDSQRLPPLSRLAEPALGGPTTA